MSNVIDRIKADFDSKGTRSVSVPEWGEDGKPLIIYSRPLTVFDSKRLNAKLGQNPAASEMCIELLIMKASDANGKKFFTKEDKSTLMRNTNPEFIIRLANELFDRDFEDTEEAEKNSETPQT